MGVSFLSSTLHRPLLVVVQHRFMRNVSIGLLRFVSCRCIDRRLTLRESCWKAFTFGRTAAERGRGHSHSQSLFLLFSVLFRGSVRVHAPCGPLAVHLLSRFQVFPNMSARPAVCLSCGRRESLRVCSGCLAAAYCCEKWCAPHAIVCARAARG